MSYPVNLTNNTKLFDLLDGTTNSDIGLTLIGRNYTNYGEFQNENFVKLLENFASSQNPSLTGAFSPLVGTLWYDTTGKQIRVYDGANWVPVSERTVSAAAPTSNKLGDQWYDTVNQQLKSWNGTSWTVVGPPYSVLDGKSGSIVESIEDIYGNKHTVVNTYTNNNLISIESFGPTFQPLNAITGFTTVVSGINLFNGSVINGLTENSQRLAGVYGNVYARTDINSTFASNVRFNSQARFGSDAFTQYQSNILRTENTALSGNIEFYLNTPSRGRVSALTLDGQSGEALVNTNFPSRVLSVTSRGYVDTQITIVNSSIALLSSYLVSNIAAVTLATATNLNAAVVSQNGNLRAVQTGINANVQAAVDQEAADVAVITANLAGVATNLNSINATLPTLAPLDSAVLIGTPTAPTATLSSNNAIIASTQYVDTTSSILSAYVLGQFGTLSATLTGQLNTGLALKANIAGPTFTGSPKAPTPAAGDNSTNLATTAFVTGAIASQKFRYTVSTQGPSGGVDGDFWFQIG